MPDDNVIKFERPPKAPPTPRGPSLLVAIIVAIVEAAILAGGSWLINSRTS